jgi:hypothetical protein
MPVSNLAACLAQGKAKQRSYLAQIMAFDVPAIRSSSAVNH